MSTNAPHRSLGGHKAWNRKRRRFWLVILCLTVLALAAFLILRAMDDALLYFRLPSDVIEQNLTAGQAFRLGGLVESGSLKKRDDGTSVTFMVTDGTTTLPVIYSGILPDLFREGQGIIADGRLDDQAGSSPIRCWPSMMKTICPKRSMKPAGARPSHGRIL